MAVYTDITDEELADFVSGYDIGTVRSCKGIAEGIENSNYLLTTTSDTYILTLYEKRVDAADLPFFLGLMQHLAAKGVASPTPVPNRNSDVLGTLCNRPAAIVTFLDGLWPRRPTPEHCAELGRALAEMHLAGSDFEIKRANALTVADWRPLYESCAGHADEVHSGLGARIEAELDYLEGHWPDDLPEGVIHADLFPDNVFFKDGKLSGLIDFYFACNDHLAYDLAICLNAWCFEADHSFNVTKARRMLTAYRSVRELSDAELATLPVLARGSALRFLLTRLYDWVNTPKDALVTPKDPLEYLDKLNFHQSVPGVGAYGLE